jgi:hypothetical protein
MIKEILNHIEEIILYGSTWAIETMTPWQRLKFYRDTGEWPGLHSKEVLEMFMQGNIDAERSAGKYYCAEKKLSRAKEAGLAIK